MKLLKSFALIVHWASFAFGTFIFLHLCSASLMHNNDATLLFSPPVMIFFGFIVFFFCSTLGWLARVALVGRVHFLPWRN